MKKINLLAIAFFILSGNLFAINPKTPDYDSYIGMRWFEKPLFNWMEANDYKKSLEIFQTDGPILFLKNYDKGYQLSFDINMSLMSMSFFQEGSKYAKFRGELPYKLKFGMNRDSLLRLIDLRLKDIDDNPFLLYRVYNSQKLELIFNSKGLTQINVVPLNEIPKANDIGFVRLVHNGKIETGDCENKSGKMSWDNGKAVYEGEWKNNLPHGNGSFTDQNNNKYQGEFKYGYFWGKGKLTVSNAYNYDGEFIMSRRHGKGNCLFNEPKGESYDGDWVADVMDGLGKYSKGPNFYYYGHMKNNKFNGRGKIVTSEGWMEGEFSEGLPNGNITQYLKKENTTIEGIWKNGKKDGLFKITDENKNVSYTKFQNDIEIKN